MKKKILALALVVALAAIMVGGTLAYFSDQDEVTNTFTVGAVKIEIFENNEATDKDVIEFDKPLTPGVNIEKYVKVKNTGINDAYIRTHIGIPTDLVDYLRLDLDGTGWTAAQTTSTATVEGLEYTVYTFDYDAAVSAGNFTSDLLKNVYLGTNVDLEEASNGDLYFVLRENGEITHRSNVLAHSWDAATGKYTSAVVKVLVASQAIQADGFNDAATALNSGFDKNPWA